MISVFDIVNEVLNIDVFIGKFINVIWEFSGCGVCIWGVCILVGNDNEWCYISIWCLVNMV